MSRSSALVASLILFALAACSPRPPEEVSISPAAYRETVTAFYTGLSALQTTQEVLARQKFDRVVALAPQEPAGWANLGLLLLRQQDLDQGAKQLAQAAALAPESGAIQRLQALGESRRGNLPEAIRHWRRALEIDPNDLEAAYALALDTERQGGPANEEQAQRVLAQLLSRTDNLAARLEYLRLTAKRGDQAAFKTALAALQDASHTWSPDAQGPVSALQAGGADNLRAAAIQVAFLKNLLLREPAYRRALAEVSTPREEVGQPLMRFLRLKNPEPEPAPADAAMTFTIEPQADVPVGDAWLSTVAASCRGMKALELATLSRDAIVAVDLDNNFKSDLVLAGPGGFCALRQDDRNRFADVTAATKLPAALLRASAYGAWTADIDTDGDLDLVLAARDGAPIVLRNNGDGTFSTREPFAGVTRARGFAWADFDGEGVPDAAFLDDAGGVHLFLNQRGGSFRPDKLPATAGAVAIAAAESSGDAIFDLLVLSREGAITRLSRTADARSWTGVTIARVDPPSDLAPGLARLLIADLDNNAAADLIVSSPTAARVLLAGPKATWTPLSNPVSFGVQTIGDLNDDGVLDLVGRLPDGRPARAMSRTTKSYRWQVLRTRATTATGDQRINSFGIGGEIELRSGLHAQKQVIASPIVHFGLGEATGADVVRITWPNGVLQSEFDTKADTTVNTTQRLKGSCPWLFAWNGREMGFVTDLIWRSPLGLRINAQATAGVVMTEDWVKVRGDQLQPRDGAYDLRVTAELWETMFFDLVSLLVVDHPAGSEVFVDERFAVPPPKLQVVPTGPVQSFASVRDDQGRDVSDLAQARDSRHIDFAGRGRYQGITRRHFVELDLPEIAPRSGPLWLVGQGWVHPTDSSINLAISQGKHDAPQGLSLEVADESGRFRQVRAGLGFPSGKDKTVLVDLSEYIGARGSRRLRLVTNLEIFWDRLGWAVGRPDLQLQPRTLDVLGADLVHRGYSITDQPSPSVPERPRYTLEGTGMRWRDLEGYYTRFGDVRELVRTVDDRYVIMNAGDELRLRFPEVSSPAPGFVRDFIVVADGWVKDGDYNTSSSRTVLPLPTHTNSNYDTAPGRLEDDDVYRQHMQDFAEYHTRYITPATVRDALVSPAERVRR